MMLGLFMYWSIDIIMPKYRIITPIGLSRIIRKVIMIKLRTILQLVILAFYLL